MLNKFLDLFLPDTCILCDTILATQTTHLCCAACWQNLPHLKTACRHCARSTPDGEICGRCLTKPLSTGIAVVPLTYEGDAIRLVRALKFENSLRAAHTLGYLVAAEVKARYPESGLPRQIVPTPMSWRRHVVRGYNQATRLAEDISKRLSIPTVNALKRRHGPTQHGRSRSARESLAANSFIYTGHIEEHIALLDDVMTTGATMRAMATTCRNAGVRRIDLWATCRTPGD